MFSPPGRTLVRERSIFVPLFLTSRVIRVIRPQILRQWPVRSGLFISGSPSHGEATRIAVDKALRNLLQEHRKAILGKWRESIFATYSPDAARFMSREKDPFANPVGQTISRALEPIWEQLVEGSDLTRLSPLVEDILRIRAVQSFKPSQALSMFVLLKRAVREELRADRLEQPLLAQMLIFESRVDAIELMAFDAFLACREKIYEIRATELRSRSQRVLEKLNRRLDERAGLGLPVAPEEVQEMTETVGNEDLLGDKRGGTI
jgi:hypothetical protein